MKRIKKILFFFFIGAVFLWIGLRYYYDGLDKQKVFDNPNFTIGRIIKYSSSGSMNNYYLTYKYKIEEQNYDKESSIPYDFFSGCEHDLKVCSDKQFWVAYQKDGPSNSLINLYIEIQDVENPVPPETLDNFR